MKAMKLVLAAGVAGAMAWTGPAWGVFGTSGAVTVRSRGNYNVEGHTLVGYPPFQVGSGDEAGVWLDGAVLFSSVGETTFSWHPQTLGEHVLEFRLNGVAVTSKTVNVKSLLFAVQNAPNPPTAVNTNISITPVTRNFGTGGGGAAIVVSGSGTWQASVSDNWITLNTTSGAAGEPVAYMAGATTNVEGRTGYVYVSGHVHTVTQDGLGATISPESATFESAGGKGTIAVTPPDRMRWQARANVDWVNVWPVNGTGVGSVSYTVAPMSDVKTRQGTLTVAGQTFTVTQYGRRMVIAPMLATCDYLPHTMSISVEALSSTSWGVASAMSWISVADTGPGKGSGVVCLSIAENPSWLERAGTVTIGTETFLVTQKGRTALEFGLSPATTTASVEGANGTIAVTATPDLPWSAKSNTAWLSLYAGTASGAGNGNVVYAASPNPTLYERRGTITVTPGDTNVAAKTHTVTQTAANSALSAEEYEFEALGGICEVGVSLADIVQWGVENTNAWLTVVGATNRVGPGTVVLQAATNETVYRKEGMVTIARKSFHVSQKARGVEVEYETKLFGADGGSDSISVHPDGQVSWTAVSSDKTWITIFGGGSGTGDGEFLYIVSPYVGDGALRTGTITVGDKVIYITQRVEVFPSVVSDGEVSEALAGAVDTRLAERLRTVADYDAFRGWVASPGLDPWAVMMSAYAWPSYLLGTKALFQNEPVIELCGVTVARGTAKGVGATTLNVGVLVLDGDRTVGVDATKVAEMFEMTGDLDDWVGAATFSTSVTQTGNDNAAMQFEVVPGEEMAKKAFLRLTLKKKQILSFAPIADQSVADRVELFATASSGGEVAFKVVSGPGKIAGNVLTFTGQGEVVVRAFQHGDNVWLPVSETQSVTVTKTAQAIDFEPIEPQLATTRVKLTATATSGGAVTFEVVSGPGRVAGNVLTFTGAGTVVVRALQSGDDCWLSATATQTVTVAKAEQTVFFAPIGAPTPADCVKLTATATSGGTVTFEVQSGPGKVTGNVLTFTGEGTVEIRAVQAGNDRWLPATATQTVVVVEKVYYLVVDLSAGANASSYTVTELDMVPSGGFNTDEYKTTKLVLRRIEPGTFMMNGEYQTTLTKPFYMGVFEVTQKQWELVMGGNPAYDKGDARPVERVTYGMIRGSKAGAGWPGSSAVDADSFLGKLRAKTGLEFDLPTEAQWEYACRAGTTSDYNNGGNSTNVLNQLGRYHDNRSDGKGGYTGSHTTVGSYLPNAWGIYDMHGNVTEWCLDRYGSLPSGVTDPQGPSSGLGGVKRGGSWNAPAQYCTSSSRESSSSFNILYVYRLNGFRLVRTLSE